MKERPGGPRQPSRFCWILCKSLEGLGFRVCRHQSPPRKKPSWETQPTAAETKHDSRRREAAAAAGDRQRQRQPSCCPCCVSVALSIAVAAALPWLKALDYTPFSFDEMEVACRLDPHKVLRLKPKPAAVGPPKKKPNSSQRRASAPQPVSK